VAPETVTPVADPAPWLITVTTARHNAIRPTAFSLNVGEIIITAKNPFGVRQVEHAE
jgi:hypothetical protein